MIAAEWKHPFFKSSYFFVTLYIFWGWFLRLSSHRVPVDALKAIFEQLEHKSKMRVIQTSMNADPCGCRVKSYSIVAMMPF